MMTQLREFCRISGDFNWALDFSISYSGHSFYSTKFPDRPNHDKDTFAAFESMLVFSGEWA